MSTALAHSRLSTDRRRRGFTFLEFTVAMAILALVAGAVVPWTLSVRERERRTRCTDNMRKLGIALARYGQDNRDELPRVYYNQKDAPHAYSAFSSPDSIDPFNRTLGVSPNDVTASLWLLIRGGYIPSEYAPPSSVFICPSSGDVVDPMHDLQGRPVAARERSNFRSFENLSYSYASPFSNAAGYGLKSDFIPKDFVLLADKNPGRRDAAQDATGPGAIDPPLQLRAANSRNHGQAGQNVLFGDMHVEFRTTPYCGVDGDNIYTAAAETPIITGQPPAPRAKGVLGTNVGPAWPTDSYLVPAEAEVQAQPTTLPAALTTTPATNPSPAALN